MLTRVSRELIQGGGAGGGGSYADVTDFGAIADGVADDTSAITNALAVSKSVYFPGGIYKISDELSLDDNHKIVLDPATRINQSVDNKNIFKAVQKTGVTL